MPNLITLNDINPDMIEAILAKANTYKEQMIRKKLKASHLKNSVAANLFFETSTRTLNSFILAEQFQDMVVLTPNLSQSALKKGESVEDTLLTMQAMGVEVFVIRSVDESLINSIQQLNMQSCVINAGIGCIAHPTQALIDLSIIKSMGKRLRALSIAIVGDIKHSRVAHSQIALFNKMGITDIRLIAPEALQIDNDSLIYQNETDINKGLLDVDVIIRLRLQKERLPDSLALDFEQFQQQYLISQSKLALAKPDSVLMHPGPCIVNEDIELALMTHSRNMILKQVEHSVPIRMACLDYACSRL